MLRKGKESDKSASGITDFNSQSPESTFAFLYFCKHTHILSLLHIHTYIPFVSHTHTHTCMHVHTQTQFTLQDVMRAEAWWKDNGF